MATDKNPKPSRSSGSSPGKKAVLPRRNKTGKKPITSSRKTDYVHAAMRSSRSGVVLRSAWPSQLRNRTKTNVPRNPGAGPASVADMQARLRNNAPSIRKRKTSNYIKGRNPK